MMLVGIGLLSLDGQGGGLNPGDMLTLICGFLFAGHIIAVEQCQKKTNTYALIVLQFAFCALYAAVYSLIFERGMPMTFSLGSVGGLLYIAVFSTTIGMSLQNIGQSMAPASHAVILLSLESVFGVLFSCPLVAYSLTLVPWKGGKVIFPVILFTMMIPWQVTQIPMYSIWAKLGLTNSFVPLILPSFLGSAYYIYLCRQYMKSLPKSVIEAARIDGANEFRILYTIVYPMCKSVLTTIAVLVFIAHWNDLNGPLLYLHDSAKYTLSIGLQQFRAADKPEWPLLMAASTVFTFPLIVLFFFAQKYFLNGISTTSGLK